MKISKYKTVTYETSRSSSICFFKWRRNIIVQNGFQRLERKKLVCEWLIVLKRKYVIISLSANL